MALTLEEWQADPALATQLKAELDKPLLKEVLEMLRELSMAKSLNSSMLLTAQNTRECFGYDVGRASVFKDLITLSTATKPQPKPKTNYADPKP